jgi:DNA polymerase-3 subunit beta
MKFEIPTQELNFLINKMQNVVSLKPTTPILANFLLEAKSDELVLTATDLNVSIRCNTEVKVTEPGATTLPARRFAQLVRELPTANVEISTNTKEMTTVISGSSLFKINGMNTQGFPLWPNLSGARSFKIPQKELKQLLSCTAFAVSKDDTRFILTGIQMQIQNGRMTFIGTDGRRLARAHCQVELNEEENCQALVPLKAVDEIIKSLLDEGDAIIHILPDKIAVEVNQTLLIAKQLSGDYPNFVRLIPEQSPIQLVLHKEELTSLLRQVSLCTKDQSHAARFIFEDGELKLEAATAEFGEGNVGMPVNYQGSKLEVCFNPGYFLDILRHCKKEVVTLNLVDCYNPGIVTDGEPISWLLEASPLFLIMPMRLSAD